MTGEPQLEAHEDAMNLVKTVFEQMGRGTVIEKAPRRPHHIPRYTLLTPRRDAFLMDFENAVSSSIMIRQRKYQKDEDVLKTRSGLK